MILSAKPLKAAVSFTKLPSGSFTVGMRCRSGGASHELAVDDALARASIDETGKTATIACDDGCAIVVGVDELHQRTTRQLSFVVDTAPDGQAHVVVPGRLFVGSQDAATNRDTLLQHGITQILNVGPDIGAAGADDGVTRLHVPIIDLPDSQLPLGADFEPLRAFIEAAPTLCHCNAGVSRSVSICIAFLLETRRCRTVDEALALIRTTRPSARPNDGFLVQLRQRQSQLESQP